MKRFRSWNQGLTDRLDYSPIACSVLICIFAGATQIYSAEVQGLYLRTIRNNLVAFGVTYAILKFSHKFIPTSRTKLRDFLLVIAVLSFSLFGVMLILLGRPPFSFDFGILSLFIFTYPRIFIGATFILGVTGYSNLQLKLKNIELTNAVELNKQQENRYYVENEKFRENIARYLHDNVQTKLYLYTLKLQAGISELKNSERELLLPLVQELDDIRNINVRSIAHVVSPSIGSIGLHAALKKLVDQYDMPINCELDIEALSLQEIDQNKSELQIGVYRIIETALGNALVRGNATNIQIKIFKATDNELEIEMVNDGQLVTKGEKPAGLGSLIINHWVHRFEGRTSLINLETNQVRFTARLKI